MERSHSISAHLTRTIIALVVIMSVVVVGAVIAVVILGKHLQEIVSKPPVYPASQLYENAVQQIDKGSYPSAESYLEQALSKQDDSTYRSQLAVVKYRLKKYSEAVDQYQKLIDQKKDVAFAYNGMGNAYRDWAEADPGNKAADLQKAEDAYRQSFKNDPQYIAAYSNDALLLQAEGQTSDALAVLQDGINQTKRPELVELMKRLKGS